MAFNEAMRKTGNIVCETPPDFFARLSRIFRFTLDVCAIPENAKCENFYTPEIDGLSQPWKGGVWCNPPYGREIGRWTSKAVEEIQKDYCDFIVMLLPARTDTSWFQRDVLNKASLHFVRGRLKFGENEKDAPFPSVIAVYAKNAGKCD